MNTSEPVIPDRIYIPAPEPDGGITRFAISPDRLIGWAEEDNGGAVDRWCRQVCEEKIHAIGRWQDDRILALEEEWSESEHYSGDEDDDRYHQACEHVVMEAEQKRRLAMEQLDEHRASIDRLVEQAREYKSAHTPPPEQTHYAGYLIALAAAAAVAYVLIT